MVKGVLEILNASLEGIKPDQAIYGLAQSVLRLQGVEQDMLPGIVGKDGEVITYVGIDDIKSLIAYHKTLSASSAQANRGHGDNPGDLINTYSMGLFLYWDRKRLDLLPDEMLMLIQSRWPQVVLDVPDIKTLRIRVGTSNFDTLKVYSQEYLETKPKLPANIHLIQINYTIEITFNPACVKACP